MEQDGQTTMAEYATMFRAAHLYYDDSPKVFEDPVAMEILDPGLRVFLKFRLVFKAAQAIWPLKPARAQILVRSRYAEDRLDEAIARGVRQYVILGAGFDTFAVRRRSADPRLEIYELDRKASQDAKAEKLARLGHVEPDLVRYVPIDFESGSVWEGLRDAGYDRERPAFFSWLGVVHYLTEGAFLRTLEQIADAAMAGSELVFDYQAERGQLSPKAAKVKAQVELAAKTRGEPIHGAYEPGRLEVLVRRLGWHVVEDLPSEEQRRRYLAHRKDGLNVLETFSLARLTRASGPRPSSRVSASSTVRRP